MTTTDCERPADTLIFRLCNPLPVAQWKLGNFSREILLLKRLRTAGGLPVGSNRCCRSGDQELGRARKRRTLEEAYCHLVVKIGNRLAQRVHTRVPTCAIPGAGHRDRDCRWRLPLEIAVGVFRSLRPRIKVRSEKLFFFTLSSNKLVSW